MARSISIARPNFPVFASPRESSIADVTAIVEGVRDAFGTFKAANDERYSGLEQQVRAMNTRMALAGRGGLDTGGLTVEAREQREVFAKFCRGKAVHAAMSSDSNPDGGYLVPTEVEKGLRRIPVDASPLRALARIVVINTDSYVATTSLNGTTGAWAAEKDPQELTQGLKLAQQEYVTHEMRAMPAVTAKLVEDASVDIASEVEFEIRQAFAQLESAAFVSGTGVKQPRGFLAYDKVDNASHAWGEVGFTKTGVVSALSDSSHNGSDAIIDLVHSLPSAYRSGAAFLANDSTIAVLRKLKDGDENYLWRPSIESGVPSQLLGYPVFPCADMPDIGAGEYPLAFANWQRAYLIVDRIGVTVLRDPYSLKPYVLFYTRKRVGGGMADFNAIKLLKVSA